LHWLKFVDFVPVSDQLLRGKITEQCKQSLGIDLHIETINGDGVQARISSAIHWPQLYAARIHHRRYVHLSGPRHGARGFGQMGARRIAENLQPLVRIPASAALAFGDNCRLRRQ
jgi:hypothetical protein